MDIYVSIRVWFGVRVKEKVLQVVRSRESSRDSLRLMAEEIETRPTITSPTPASPLIIGRLTDRARPWSFGGRKGGSNIIALNGRETIRSDLSCS